jgi:hypothetical protein
MPKIPSTISNFWHFDCKDISFIHDIVLYLDSDRILPQNYLKLVVENINDNLFLFPLYLYSTLKDLPLSFIKEIRDELNSDYLNYKK